MYAVQDEDGSLYDAESGEELEHLPRGRSAAGGTLYVLGRVRWWALVRRYALPGDRVTGPRPGVVRGLVWRTSGRPARVTPAASWGVSPDLPPLVQLEQLQRVRAEWEALGEAPRNTAGSAATEWVRRELADLSADGRPHQLPPAYRWQVRHAGYLGPALALRAGVPGGEGVELDRIAAYLHELRRPLPVLETWQVEPLGAFDRVRLRMERAGREALVTARVDLAPGGWGVPCPLPVRAGRRGVRWGGGEDVVGCWPLGWLASAVDWGGCQVREVLDVVSYRAAPYLAPLADRIDAIAYRPLAKALYTRASTVPGFLAWPSAVVTGHEGEVGEWSGSPPWWSQKVQPWHRPDITGAIMAGNCWALVMELFSRLQRGEAVALLHVDAMWAGGDSAPGPGWAEKGRGLLRVYGPGQYDVGEKAGRMGGALAAAFSARLLSDELGRWSGDPMTDASAVWAPHPTACHECEPWCSSRDTGLTPMGWLRDRAAGPAEVPPCPVVWDEGAA